MFTPQALPAGVYRQSRKIDPASYYSVLLLSVAGSAVFILPIT